MFPPVYLKMSQFVFLCYVNIKLDRTIAGLLCKILGDLNLCFKATVTHIWLLPFLVRIVFWL